MSKQFTISARMAFDAKQALDKLNEVSRKVSQMNLSAGKLGAGSGFKQMIIQAGTLTATLSRGFASASGVLARGLRGGYNVVSGIVGKLKSISFSVLKYLGIGTGAIAGGIYAADKVLAPTAKKEIYEKQLGVQGQGDLMKWLQKQATLTPQSLDELIRAAILMGNFKIDVKKYLEPFMNTGAMMSKDITEVVRSMGYIKAGRTGEAMESLSTMGITRMDLKELGIKFDRNGALLLANGDDRDKASERMFQAVISIMNKKFPGGARVMSDTIEGKKSNLWDAVWNALADGMEKFRTTYKGIISMAISQVESFGEALKRLDWDGINTKVTEWATKFNNIISKLWTPEGRSNLWEGVKLIFKGFLDGLFAIPALLINNLSAIGTKFIQGLISAGTFIGVNLWQGFFSGKINQKEIDKEEGIISKNQEILSNGAKDTSFYDATSHQWIQRQENITLEERIKLVNEISRAEERLKELKKEASGANISLGGIALDTSALDLAKNKITEGFNKIATPLPSQKQTPPKSNEAIVSTPAISSPVLPITASTSDSVRNVITGQVGRKNKSGKESNFDRRERRKAERLQRQQERANVIKAEQERVNAMFSQKEDESKRLSEATNQSRLNKAKEEQKKRHAVSLNNYTQNGVVSKINGEFVGRKEKRTGYINGVKVEGATSPAINGLPLTQFDRKGRLKDTGIPPKDMNTYDEYGTFGRRGRDRTLDDIFGSPKKDMNVLHGGKKEEQKDSGGKLLLAAIYKLIEAVKDNNPAKMEIKI